MRGVIVNLLNPYSRWMNKREFNHQPYAFNERPVEFGFVFRQITNIYPKSILDVGTGTTALPHLLYNCGFLVTATDNIKDYWSSGMYNRHFHVIDDDITNTHLEKKFDLVTCISVLEHITDFNAAVRNMFKLLNPNGYLILTFPYTEQIYVRNVYDLSESTAAKNIPYRTQSFSRNEINKWLQDNGAFILEQEYWQFWDGDFWTVGNKLIPPKKVSVNEKHQLTCILLQNK